MAARHGVAEVSEIVAGKGHLVEVAGKQIAVFNLGDRFVALDNTCPHQGGPLGEGYLETNGVVSCPWHGWTFDLKTGVSPIDGDVRVACYPVRIVDGDVLVDLP